MEKRLFLCSAHSVFFGPYCIFFQKNHPKFLKRLIFILEKGTFFFEQLFPVMARLWCPARSQLFFGLKSWFLAKKSDFCHMTPIFVDDPFLALDMTVNFPPWKRFFDFPFRSYSSFRKKIWLTAQKVFPPPTVGVLSASKSPSALSARASKKVFRIDNLQFFAK